MSKARLVKELGEYLARHKLLFLIPLLVLLAFVAGIAIIAQSPAIAPLIYSLF